MRVIFILLYVLSMTLPLCAQTPEATATDTTDYTLPVADIIGTWVKEQQPFTQSVLTKATIQANNFAQDAPYLLQNLPSAVVTSDAGMGVGYTGIRLRGTDATRINVTVNGIPLNDAESQQVYWVDLPDIMASAENVQVQRGVGNSTNGGGAFGGTINVNTTKVNAQPYSQLMATAGSFNTQKYSLSAGTGLLNNHFTLDGRASYIRSDGFIDRASSALRSYFLTGGYLNERSSLRFNIFSGHERTYQAWYGVPAQYINDATLRTYNPAGTEKPGSPYDDQVDDYTQTHYQALYHRQIAAHWHGNVALHYTRGKGYYEEYKAQQALVNYFPVINNPSSDLVRRRWLDNDFYGVVANATYQKDKWDVTVGGSAHRYHGNHFGNVIWLREGGLPYPNAEYYRNKGTKNDAHIFAKATYQWRPTLSWYADAQVRQVQYQFVGRDEALANVTQTVQLRFFNPKVGINFTPSAAHRWYASVAVGNHEPNRDDYTNSTPSSRPRPETLYDVELGYRFRHRNGEGGLNFYGMYYTDQLVLTGRINDVGEYTRVNIPESYRVGLEWEHSVRLLKQLQGSYNVTLSRNAINHFTTYIDDWDTGEQIATTLHDTPLAFSPALTGNVMLDWTFWEQTRHKAQLNWVSKYVGKQYLDNTGNEATTLAAYWVNHLTLRYEWQPATLKQIALSLSAQNVLNERYETNGWAYRFRSAGYDPRPDDPYTRAEGNHIYHQVGYFPQAGRHFLLLLQVTL